MRKDNPPKLIARISWGDHIVQPELGDHALSSPRQVERAFKKYRELGVTTIGWRMWGGGHTVDELEFYVDYYPFCYNWIKSRFKGVWAKEDASELRWAVECAHKYDLKLYAWITPFSEGAPSSSFAEMGKRMWVSDTPWGTMRGAVFGCYCKFVKEHPEYELADRIGKRRHYGVLEWAYPEVRKHWLDTIESIVKEYEPDGLAMDTRSECICPDWADQFGFNEPIVKEYEKRYGVNILKEDFDLEKWRRLRGEYFTLFLKETRELLSIKKDFTWLLQGETT